VPARRATISPATFTCGAGRPGDAPGGITTSTWARGPGHARRAVCPTSCRRPLSGGRSRHCSIASPAAKSIHGTLNGRSPVVRRTVFPSCRRGTWFPTSDSAETRPTRTTRVTLWPRCAPSRSRYRSRIRRIRWPIRQRTSAPRRCFAPRCTDARVPSYFGSCTRSVILHRHGRPAVWVSSPRDEAVPFLAWLPRRPIPSDVAGVRLSRRRTFRRRSAARPHLPVARISRHRR